VLTAAQEAKSEIRTIILLIGPEGGFSHEEVEMAVEAGFTPVSLGDLILRTETAPIAALSILRYEFGHSHS
jgi:16S rRNA (uracil1498-N3)-methyltransferase